MPERRARNWVFVGALSGFLGVALGAFGAHGLEATASAEAMAWWRTAVLYHLVHAPVLVLVGLLPSDRGGRDAVGLAFLAGTVVFSGTLYALALGAPRWLGAVTPVGGIGLLLGWALLAFGARRRVEA